MESSHACTGSPTPRGSADGRESAARGIAFRRFRARRHPGQAQFRGSIAGLRAPLSTLRCALAGRQRMTRGHRDSLGLRCRTLSFPSLMPVVRRFPENGASDLSTARAGGAKEPEPGDRSSVTPTPIASTDRAGEGAPPATHRRQPCTRPPCGRSLRPDRVSRPRLPRLFGRCSTRSDTRASQDSLGGVRTRMRPIHCGAIAVAFGRIRRSRSAQCMLVRVGHSHFRPDGRVDMMLSFTR
jgi:hypothetical protein